MPLKRTRLLFLAMLVTGAARADEKTECVTAYSNAQDLRAESKLVEAHRELVVCARAACPDFIARDCSQWLGEVEASTPTIVVAAKDGARKDVTDVVVTVDGLPFVDQLDGRAIPMNPGPHEFTFRHAEAPVISEHVLVTMGEKNRAIEVTFSPRPTPVEPPPQPRPPPLSRSVVPVSPAPPRTLSTLGWVGLGVGGAALLTGVAFGAAALATKGSHCVDDVCDPGTISTIDAEATVSTVGVVTGLVLGAVGVTLLLLQPRQPRTARLAPSALRVTF